MQKVIKVTFYVLLSILGLTALLTMGGVASLWFGGNERTDLPHLSWLIGAVIVEAAGLVFMLAKKGFRYLPSTVSNKRELETLNFMKELISSGSSVCIVSNRVSWLKGAEEIMEAIKLKAEKGTNFEIITPSSVEVEIKQVLEPAGVIFYETGEDIPPNARFTLINANRSGAEKLAISRGIHPDHEITIFDSSSGPQIIGMAKDIINKSKELSSASSVV